MQQVCFCMYYLLENVIILNYKGDLRRVYSLLQNGHRLEKCLITTIGGISVLDCVKEFLRTTRCLSVNYFQPALFCEVNFESKDTVFQLYLAKTGWFYSEQNAWERISPLLYRSDIYTDQSNRDFSSAIFRF